MKKILLLLIPLILLTGCKSTNSFNFNDSSKKIEDNNELKAIVYKYLVDKNYLNEPTLDTFEITSITKQGYYKTNSDVVYLKFDCTYQCVDETDSCILNNQAIEKQAKWLFEEDDKYYFFLEYDLKNDKVLGRRGSYGKAQDYKQIVE